MPRYFLRFDGVNQDNVIDDTDDLSTRRGGGLMLLNAALQFEDMLGTELKRLECTGFKRIATGASIGLFQFEAEESRLAEIKTAIGAHFRGGSMEYPHRDGESTGHIPYAHGTFVFDIVPLELADSRSPFESEWRTEQLATAANRWKQLCEPSLSLVGLWPAESSAERSVGECYVDCVRPARTDHFLPKDPGHTVSESTFRRHVYGRDARRSFYERETGRANLTFTNAFGEIGDAKGLSEEVAPANAHDKLAVLYLDGNDFNKKGGKKFEAGGAAGYSKWSDAIRDHHRDLLARLIERTESDSGWRNGSQIRLEMLLWGGDEIIWVVPAWKGWELVESLFKAEHRIGGEAVTYGCGLVFCHTKAPIKDIVTLAKRLGDRAKDAGKKTHHLAYEVMESLDDITSDLDEHRAKWLPEELKTAAADPLVFDPTILTALLPALQSIDRSDDFPTRQLYRLCKLWREGRTADDKDFAACVKRLTAEKLKEPVETALDALDSSRTPWLHLLQMLPYIPGVAK